MSIYNSSDAKIIQQVEDWFRDSRKRTRAWRTAAREDFDFYAGEQWSSDDLEELRDNNRPCVTFNRVAPTIDSVTGSERSNRQETRYLPRTTSDQENDGPLSEMWTEAGRWVRDECDAEDEESDAFEDALICGLGFTETWIDFESEPDGQIREDRLDVLNVYYDPDAIKRNLSDGRRIQYIKMMSRQDIKETWPGKSLRGLADSEIRIDSITEPHIDDEEQFYRNDQAGRRQPNDFPVCVTQWWEREPIYRVIDPSTGMAEFLTKEEIDALDEIGQKPPAVRQTRKVYYQAFTVGKTLLEKSELHPDEDTIIPGFTIQAITGKRDKTDNTWFGLMRAMKDPARWSNKFFSQIQDIINSNAKGGIIAEKGAFTNQRKAEEDWAKPDKIIWVEDGSLSGQKPRIQERTSAAVPASLDRLMQMAIGAVRDTSGVNIEMLGTAGRTQSGIVEQSRIQQGLITLAIFFDSLRRYRKDQGRILLHFMNAYIPDGTLIRVVGKDRYIKFAKDPSVRKFDLIVDQSPTSPNFKQEVWNTIQNFAPAMVKAGVPMPWEELISYSPLPFSVQEKIRKFIRAQAKSPQDAQIEQQAKITQLKQLQADVEETLATASEKKAKGIRQLMANLIDMESNKIQADDVAVRGMKVFGDILNATQEQPGGGKPN